MPGVSLDLFIGKDMYAKKNGVIGYKGDFKTPRYTFNNGAFMGNVYSYVTDPTTHYIFLMTYVTQQDYNNFIPTYFRINSDSLNIIGLEQAIKDQQQKEADIKAQQAIDEKGYIAYYVEKYVPIVLIGYFGVKLLSNTLNR